MDKVERYKKMYSSENESDVLVFDKNGKLAIPTWLLVLLLHDSGLKSRKKRLVKKRVKREVMKIISKYSQSNET